MHRRQDRRPSAPWQVAGLAIGLLAGCAAPRGQVDEARQQIIALRAELAQAKDVAARLRSENRDMAARSVDDARRLTALEEANGRLEQSVGAYQKERDEYASALDQIKTAIATSNPPTRR